MKQIDLHVHSKLSKGFPFDESALWNIVKQAKDVGLDGIALTEHFHASNFWDAYLTLEDYFDYVDGAFLVDDGFRILTGAELGVSEVCDLLLIGTLKQLREVDLGLVHPATAGYKPPFDEALAVAKRAGVLVIGAHMYRPKKQLAKLGCDQLRRLDALEMNGRDFYNDILVKTAGEWLGRPTVGGSDAHFWPQVGIKRTVLPIKEITLPAVFDAVFTHRSEVSSLPYGPAVVEICQEYKKMVKAERDQVLQPVMGPWGTTVKTVTAA